MATHRTRAAARTPVAALLDGLDAEAARCCGTGFASRGNEWVAPADIGAAQCDPGGAGERHLTRVPSLEEQPIEGDKSAQPELVQAIIR